METNITVTNEYVITYTHEHSLPECISHITALTRSQEDISESLRLRIKYVVDLCKKKRKNKAKDLSSFLKTPFSMPKPAVVGPSTAVQALKEETKARAKGEKEILTLTSKVSEQKETLASLKEAVMELQQLNSKLKDESLTLQSANKDLTETNTKLKEKLSLKGKFASMKVKNLKRKLQRSECRLSDMTTPQVKKKKPTPSDETVKMATLKASHRKLQKRLSATQRRHTSKQDSLQHEMSSIQRECEEYQRQLNEAGRAGEAEEAMKDKSLCTFLDGKYTNEVRLCILKLMLECNVPSRKVTDVVQTVLQSMTGHELSNVPSQTTVNRLYSEALKIAQSHAAEEMGTTPVGAIAGNTLHFDGTTKHHKSYEGYQITTPSGKSVSLGMKEVVAGDAASLMSCFEETISELQNAMTANRPDKFKHLLSTISSTMSDQGPSNKPFLEKLQALKSEVLNTAHENWADLSPEMQAEISCISNFYCKMHLLVNFATDADSTLRSFENMVVTDGKNPHAYGKTESGTIRLLRTAAKAFTARGCDKSGVESFWMAFLSEREKQNHLVTFKANRYNIIFYEAAAVYLHQEDIRTFLSKWPSPNELLKSIAFDINQKVIMSSVRALGIIDKCITGPLWRAFEESGNIYTVNNPLQELQSSLERWSQDAQSLLKGECALLDGVMHKDEMFDSLMTSGDPEFEKMSQMALELLCGSLLILLERQAVDHLQGGQHSEPTASQIFRCKAVPKTNTISERNFGILDNLIKAKPGVKSLALESLVLWCANKPSSWLHSLSPSELDHQLDEARRCGPSLYKAWKERETRLLKDKQDQLFRRQQQKEETQQKRYNQKAKITKEITALGGAWLTNQVINRRYQEMSESDFKKAIVCQLNFQRHILEAQGDRTLFQQSVNKKALTAQEMMENLKKVLSLNLEPQLQEDTNALKTLSLNELTEQHQELKEKLKVTRQAANTKLLIAKLKKVWYPRLIAQPDLLVGKDISHQCYDDAHNIKWYKGAVLSITKTCGKKPESTSFEV